MPWQITPAKAAYAVTGKICCYAVWNQEELLVIQKESTC